MSVHLERMDTMQQLHDFEHDLIDTSLWYALQIVFLMYEREVGQHVLLTW